MRSCRSWENLMQNQKKYIFENLPENYWDGTGVWVEWWWWPYVRLGSDQFDFISFGW